MTFDQRFSFSFISGYVTVWIKVNHNFIYIYISHRTQCSLFISHKRALLWRSLFYYEIAIATMENLPLMFYVRSPVPLFRGGSEMLNQNVIYPFVDFVVNVNNSRKSNTEALLLTENISSFPCTWNTRTSLISSLVVYFRTRFISHSTSAWHVDHLVCDGRSGKSGNLSCKFGCSELFLQPSDLFVQRETKLQVLCYKLSILFCTYALLTDVMIVMGQSPLWKVWNLIQCLIRYLKICSDLNIRRYVYMVKTKNVFW